VCSSDLVFKLTDKFNNITTTDVYVTRQKEITTQPLIRPEYNRIIAKKQIAALTSMLKSRADEKLRKITEEADIEHQQFGKVDDLISYLKEEAAKKSISPEELDKLALKVAVMDNVLSQAAVDLLARYSDGDLKKILSELDIYQAKLKTWTDLQEYIQLKTGGKTSPQDLNNLAAAILTNVDPSISVLKKKILAYSNNSDAGTIIRQSVATVDLSNIKIKEKWLQAFYKESIKEGLTEKQLSDLLVTIGLLPGTGAQQFLNDLIEHAEEPLLSALKSIDLKKEKINTPQDLLNYLLNNKDKSKYPEDAVYKAIANLITSKDIPTETIASHNKPAPKSSLWILWVFLGALAAITLYLFWKRNKKKSKK
jgi:hypothetical protein